MYLLLYTCNGNVGIKVLMYFLWRQKCACRLAYERVVGGSRKEAVEEKQEKEAN